MINLNDYIKQEYDKSIDCGCKARYYIDEIKNTKLTYKEVCKLL